MACVVCAQAAARRYQKTAPFRARFNQYCARRYQKKKRDIHAKIYAKLRDDFLFRLRHRLRCRLNKAIKLGKGASAVRDLGCTILEFINYIADRFEPGMSWDNWGEWHLDHIRPLVSFDLADRDQCLAAVHYTNYQPLWAPENLRKGSRDASAKRCRG
jgi:hypothetical protein